MSVLELPSKIHYLYGLSRKKNSLTKVQKMIKKVVALPRICRHDPAIKSENGYRLASTLSSIQSDFFTAPTSLWGPF